MTDQNRNDPFNVLKDIPPPAPNAEARARALSVARAAFADAQNSPAKKIAAPAKAFSFGDRLTSIITSLRRISIMDTRIPIGTAAIALLLLPLGVQLYNSTALTPGNTLRQDIAVPATPAEPVREELADAPPPAVEVAPVVVAEPEAAPVTESLAAPAVVTNRMVAAPPAPVPSMHAPMSVQQQSYSQSYGQAMQSAPGMMMKESAAAYAPMAAVAEPSGDTFTRFEEQRLKVAAEDPVSTFSLDVDTASYSYVRRMLEDGFLPEANAVRIEELINYFPYDYPSAPDATQPFQPTISLFPTPWNDKTQILRIGIKGYEPDLADTRSNLVFLIDTSGSMDAPDKLPLLKRAFALLLDQLSANDTVSIVTYAGSAGVALEPTSADRKAQIMAALDQLYAGGGTAGAQGIELAYRLAEQAKIAEGTNRVILATDGDFNLGISDPAALEEFIAAKRNSGIGLSVLGFGRGNLDDATMQALAQNGNGNASYISSFNEAKKVLVEEIGGTLHTIAQDVKVQVEFNPAAVAEYRLIGYETRALNREDFNNDAVDAGDVGAGTTVTALYEITPAGSEGVLVDPLRYGSGASSGDSAEIAFLKMRYKLPGSAVSQLIEVPVTPQLAYGDIADADADARFAAAVAAFGQKLRGSVYGAQMSWKDIAALAQGARGADEGGYRAEFIRLIGTAALLKPDTDR